MLPTLGDWIPTFLPENHDCFEHVVQHDTFLRFWNKIIITLSPLSFRIVPDGTLFHFGGHDLRKRSIIIHIIHRLICRSTDPSFFLNLMLLGLRWLCFFAVHLTNVCAFNCVWFALWCVRVIIAVTTTWLPCLMQWHVNSGNLITAVTDILVLSYYRLESPKLRCLKTPTVQVCCQMAPVALKSSSVYP